MLTPASAIWAILATARDCFRGRASQMEVLALRHQLNVLEHSVKRPKLSASDRFFWACLAATWRSWRSALIIVKPETVIAWHRDGFRLFWRWKSRQGRRGRPRVTVEIRQVIRQMSRDNQLFGERLATMVNSSSWEFRTDGGRECARVLVLVVPLGLRESLSPLRLHQVSVFRQPLGLALRSVRRRWRQ